MELSGSSAIWIVEVGRNDVIPSGDAITSLDGQACVLVVSRGREPPYPLVSVRHMCLSSGAMLREVFLSGDDGATLLPEGRKPPRAIFVRGNTLIAIRNTSIVNGGALYLLFSSWDTQSGKIMRELVKNVGYKNTISKWDVDASGIYFIPMTTRFSSDHVRVVLQEADESLLPPLACKLSAGKDACRDYILQAYSPVDSSKKALAFRSQWAPIRYGVAIESVSRRFDGAFVKRLTMDDPRCATLPHPRHIFFSGDGATVYALGYRGRLNAWSVATGRCVSGTLLTHFEKCRPGEEDTPKLVSLAPHGQLISGYSCRAVSKHLSLWRVDGGGSPVAYINLGRIYAVLWSDAADALILMAEPASGSSMQIVRVNLPRELHAPAAFAFGSVSRYAVVMRMLLQVMRAFGVEAHRDVAAEVFLSVVRPPAGERWRVIVLSLARRLYDRMMQRGAQPLSLYTRKVLASYLTAEGPGEEPRERKRRKVD